MKSGSGEGSMMDDYESLISTTDAELLERSWRNEKVDPEILQFELSLVQRSTEQIQLMGMPMEVDGGLRGSEIMVASFDGGGGNGYCGNNNNSNGLK
ncbi:hypothetical protein LOK49_LG06G03149 [Camellia lanceoleosa]|uniref:Uncharacterized protein n=1 Tax=Camellia lanceoleosa TaxID=1840588 RepID=A0ACC0HGI8_9ERIC|nr:hypothetical protein LOK49_LG06G03149 [Camellia lanceoleosa]